MKILNLYSGIGGNRRLWGDEHEITAVEWYEQIAKVYQERFPKDKIVIADAHQYLLDHYRDFDFIWSSPPCQSHSRTNHFLNPQGIVRYPDMKLYEEILFLSAFCKTKYCIENVISYYPPLIAPTKIGRHYFWANFDIPIIEQPNNEIGKMCGKGQKQHKKTTAERNMVNADLGLHVLQQLVKRRG